MLFILVLFAGVLAAQTADLVFTGGRIYTVNPRAHATSGQPPARAIAIKDGKILAVSDDEQRHVGASTRKIDLKGATVIPGLIDSHVHMRGLGESLEILDLRHARSPAEVASMVRTEARRRKPGEWIRGRAWDQTTFPGGQFPNHEPITAAAPENPVYLTRVDGHAGWANRKAMEVAGITAETKDPPGGKIHRQPPNPEGPGAKGEPTGIFIDRAQGLVTRHVPAPSAEQVRSRIARAAVECARLGLTSVHDAGSSRADLTAYRELIAERKLPVRVYAMIGGTGDLWTEYLKKGPEIGDRLTVRSIKLVADGALGSRGAAMIAPYSDDPGNSGLEILRRDEIERVARQAVAAGFQVNTHAIGDRANRNVLEAYGAALGGPNDRRFRVEHAQVVALSDFPLFAKYSIIASIQATHATSDMRWAEARVGPERVKGTYAWRRFLALGVTVANGSDFPVEKPEPLPGFYASITRQDASGNPEGGWFPDQRMTRQEALASWTIAGAFAAFEEKTKGSLEPGKLADLVVLSDDIMTIPAERILRTRVKMTLVGGEVVYSE